MPTIHVAIGCIVSRNSCNITVKHIHMPLAFDSFGGSLISKVLAPVCCTTDGKTEWRFCREQLYSEGEVEMTRISTSCYTGDFSSCCSVCTELGGKLAALYMPQGEGGN